MLFLLRKIFINDYKNIGNDGVRVRHAHLASIFGVITNVFLFIVKLVFGIISSSISLIADAINNLSDTSNSIVSLVGFKLSSKPADKEHPYGHQRIEYLTGLVISIVIVVLGINLLWQSIDRIINHVSSVFTLTTFIILGAAILLKIYQSYFNYRIAKLINSITLKATALDSLLDVLATTGILVSGLLNHFYGLEIDGYIGIAVSLFISYSGIKMIKETVNPLIGSPPDNHLVKKIMKDILSFPEVLGVHDLRVHSYGPTKMFMSLHIEVDVKMDLLSSHQLTDSIEVFVKEKYNIELVTHLDPIDLDDEEALEVKNKIETYLGLISSELSFHDFRLVKEKKKKLAIFELVVPFDFKLSNKQILNKLKEFTYKDNLEAELVVTFETPYIETKSF
ncbi:MAG: cation diffusion facilitator family transporter [Bacilli bacterium]